MFDTKIANYNEITYACLEYLKTVEILQLSDTHRPGSLVMSEAKLFSQKSKDIHRTEFFSNNAGDFTLFAYKWLQNNVVDYTQGDTFASTFNWLLPVRLCEKFIEENIIPYEKYTDFLRGWQRIEFGYLDEAGALCGFSVLYSTHFAQNAWFISIFRDANTDFANTKVHILTCFLKTILPGLEPYRDRTYAPQSFYPLLSYALGSDEVSHFLRGMISDRGELDPAFLARRLAGGDYSKDGFIIKPRRVKEKERLLGIDDGYEDVKKFPAEIQKFEWKYIDDTSRGYNHDFFKRNKTNRKRAVHTFYQLLTFSSDAIVDDAKMAEWKRYFPDFFEFFSKNSLFKTIVANLQPPQQHQRPSF